MLSVVSRWRGLEITSIGKFYILMVLIVFSFLGELLSSALATY